MYRRDDGVAALTGQGRAYGPVLRMVYKNSVGIPGSDLIKHFIPMVYKISPPYSFRIVVYFGKMRVVGGCSTDDPDIPDSAAPVPALLLASQLRGKITGYASLYRDKHGGEGSALASPGTGSLRCEAPMPEGSIRAHRLAFFQAGTGKDRKLPPQKAGPRRPLQQ